MIALCDYACIGHVRKRSVTPPAGRFRIARPTAAGHAPERHGPRLRPDGAASPHGGADRGHLGVPGAALTSAP